MKEYNNLEAYHSDLPYPEIKVTKENKDYANLLKNNYVGLVSEMTATNQYFYHYIELDKIDKEISNMLINISLVEMKHMEILAKLISLLGEKPVYSDNKNIWNGDYIYYGDNILVQLEADLQAEYDAVDIYEKNIELIDDPYIKNMLRRIILDEDIHINLFLKAIDKVKDKDKETLTDLLEETFPNK